MRHDVLIAVGEYDAAEVTDIKCCERDISKLAAHLANIPTVDRESPVQTVISTAHGRAIGYKPIILSRIEDALKSVSTEDTLLLAFSCHGLTASGANYLLPTEGRPDDLESCIPFDWLKEFLDNVDCKFKIILVDACHSGDSQMVFKKGVTFGFDDRTAVDALVRNSRGVVYASACGHNQYAYVRPDGEQSVWFHSVSTRLATLSAIGQSEPILMHDVITEAAVRTSTFVRQHFDADQTPFYFQSTEGLISLGIAVGARSANTQAPSLAALTRDSFRKQFEEAFGKTMPVEFDAHSEQRLAGEGWELALVVHVGPSNLRGRLAVIFDSITTDDVTLDYLQEIQRAAERHALDRVILPKDSWLADLCRQADLLDRLQLVELPRFAPSGPMLFRDYFIPSEHDRSDVVQANCNSQSLITHMGKMFHIVLADLAAPTYDDHYGETAFGTERAMAFEEDLVNSTIARMEHTNMAIDLGCGTGRHTFQLADRFDRVVGYDFSQGMIRIANEKKRREIVEKGRTIDIEFDVRDVEEEPFQFDAGSLDLVIGCFGMGSFLREPVPFLAGIKEQLRPGGKLLLSFYNADALVYQAPPPWRDNALSAVLVPDRDELEVSLEGGERFRVFCRAYRYDLLKGQLSRIFDTVQIWSCPAFASFLPGDFFLRGPNSTVARSVIASVDRNLAVRADLPIGAYFTVLCVKADDASSNGTMRAESRDILALHGEGELLSDLARRKIEYELIEHRRVRNVEDVRRELGVDGHTLVKAILAVEKDNGGVPVVLVLQGSRRLDVDKVSRWLGRTPRQWRFATQKEVQRVYGLEIGGVPPFGYSSDVRVVFDAALAREETAVCGIGNPRCSLRLDMNDLVSIAKAEIADISTR